MEVGKECGPYLKSTEVIRILQSTNDTFKSRVLSCINTCRALICNNIITVHKLIETDILNMCCENAFQDTQLIFVQNVELNKFRADYETCIPYIKGIFRKKYWYEYQKELNRKMMIQNMKLNPNADGDNSEGEALNEIRKKIQLTLATLNVEDQKMYRLRYEEGLKVKDIAARLHILPQTVSAKLIKFHHRFGNSWNYKS